MNSFLKKLEKSNWTNFNYLTEIASDLIGARVVCWFLNDCYGMLDYIKSSAQFTVNNDDIRDYIKQPKASGYRSLHLFTEVSYDRLNTSKKDKLLTSNSIVCEIQIRTKIQDVFGDLTHEFHYKEGQSLNSSFKKIEEILANLASRLALEDNAFMILRDIFKDGIQQHQKITEGITDSK